MGVNFNYFEELVNRYPIVNEQWFVGDKMYCLSEYMHNLGRGIGTVKGGYEKYKGLRNYFVRYSAYDDDKMIVNYNIDPWDRPFIAYKSGHAVNVVKLYTCEPYVVTIQDAINYGYIPHIPKWSGDVNEGYVMMYLITTTVEGHLVYCLDVIEDSLHRLNIWPKMV